jgi:hypothetical protein
MNKPIVFRGDMTIVAAPGQVSADLSGEAAILNLQSGKYYGLKAVGARIWELVQQPRTLAELQAAILQEYDVPEEQCARDLEALLGQLAQEGLIEVR